MPWARASSLARHMACPAASYLPRFDRGKWEPGYISQAGLFAAPLVEPEARSTSAAAWGTACHAAVAQAPDATEPFISYAEPHRELWPARLGEHELTVSYDCRTGEIELYRSPIEEERSAWKAARGVDCVVGTADWWGQLPTGEPWIEDLKTGWQVPEVLTPQTMFYAMVRGKLSPDWDTGRVSIAHWPKSYVSQPPVRHWRQVSSTVLLAFEGELQQAWTRTIGRDQGARPGPHCLWCPSAAVCDRANT